MEQDRCTGREPRSPARTARDRPKAPASPRTLRAWRRIGLVLGVPAAVLLVAAVVIRSVPGSGDVWLLALAVPGVLGGLLAVVFLRRVWSEPGSPVTAASRRGQWCATAFLNLWGLGVVLNAVELQVAVPDPLQHVLAAAAATALAATIVLAPREPPAYARG